MERDVRFKEIIESQLGENGLSILTNMSFLFVFCLIIMISTISLSLLTKSTIAIDKTVDTNNIVHTTIIR